MVLELPGLARENHNWKIYRAHILNSAAAEGVVSHLSGAAPKPVDSRGLEAWNSSNAVAKYIILEVITDSLLARLMHHELAHTLFSHLAAIFGDHKPIAIEPPAEQSDEDEPLQEDSHSKSDGADSACTADIVEEKDVERAGAAAENPIEPPQAPDGLSSADRSQEMEQCGRERITHDTDRETGHSGLPSELKTTEIHDEKPSGTTPAGIPNIPSTPSTNTTSIYPKDPGHPPNAPDGTSRGDDQETAVNGGQWQRTVHEVNRNDGKASPAPNLADRTSEMTTGDGPIPSSRTRPKNAVKHQRMSTRYIPLPNGRANAIAQRSDGHPKPIIHLPKRHTLPLEGERDGVATNGYTRSSSGRPMPQKLAATSIELEELVTVSIESEKPHSGEMPRVRLASVRWHTDDVNGPGSGADALKGQADESEGRTDELRARADASNTSNEAETVVVSHRTGAGTYLSSGDAKCAVDETEGLGSHADASNGQTDAQSVTMDALMSTNAQQNISISHGDEPDTYLGAADAKHAVNETDGIGSHADALSGHRDTLNTSNNAETARLGFGDGAETYLGARDAKRDVDETDGLGGHADASNGQTDAPSVQTDALMPANAPEIVSTNQTESEAPNPPSGDAKRGVDLADGLTSHTDTSTGHENAHSVKTDALKPANATQIVRTRPNDSKSQNSPVETAWQCSDEPNACRHHSDVSSVQTDAPSVQMDALTPANGTERVRTRQIRPKPPDSPAGSATSRSDATDSFGSHTDTSSVCTDVHCAVNGTKTAANRTEHVKTRQMESKTRNSPHTRKNATPKYIYRWKRVSVGDGDVYVPQNTPIDTASRNFVFGRVEGGVEAIAPKVVDETTGDGDGRWNGGDGDVNGTTSSGNVDSTQVEAALLATDSQQTCSSRITRRNDLPVSFWPPIQPADRPYGPARCQRRRGKLKIERINDKSVSQTPKVEMTHLRRAHATQPRSHAATRKPLQNVSTGSTHPSVDTGYLRSSG